MQLQGIVLVEGTPKRVLYGTFFKLTKLNIF